jgi:AraC-like DNA-binding protein
VASPVRAFPFVIAERYLSAGGAMLHKDMLERLCRARGVLDNPGDLRIPMKAVAASAGMSVFHFSRVFRAVFGQSPNQYRLEARIRFARASLGFGTVPITEIAFAAGFASPSTCSPALYRKRLAAAGRARTGTESELHPGCLTLMTRLPKPSTI